MVALLALAASSSPAGAQSALDPALTYRVPIDRAPMRGPADAPITIVELSDFSCPFCVRAQRTLAELMRLYPGRIRLVYRHNLLDPEDGTLAAEASMAAASQGAFWPMHDRIFAAGGVVTRSQLEGFARELGLDMTRFRGDLDDRRLLGRVRADAEMSQRLGLASTPVFFVNGRLVKGARSLGVFVAVVEQELARVKTLLARGVSPRRLYSAIMASAIDPAEAPANAQAGGDEPDYDHGFAGLETAGMYRVGPGLPGHAVGPADALVTVVVFTDFECPYCAKLAPVLSAMRADYPDDVRIVIRHLPLRMHPNAQLAAEALAAAAAQSKMWPMHERMFSQPENLELANLLRHAEAIGLDLAAFRAALDTRKYLDSVAGDAVRARSMGVTGTPTLFINGTPVRGVAPYPTMKEVFLEPKLAEARDLVAGGVPRAEVYEAILSDSTGRDVGNKSQFPDSSGPLEIDREDAEATLLEACRSRDSELAQRVHDQLGSRAQLDEARAACQVYGVELSPSRE